MFLTLKIGMELFLVNGLDVPLEGAGFTICFFAVRTLVRPLAQMDSIDVALEVTGNSKCFIAVRTLMRPHAKMNSIDVSLKVAGLAE